MSAPLEQVWVLSPDGMMELVDQRPVGTISIRPAKIHDEATVRLFQNITRAVRGAEIMPTKSEVGSS